MATVRDMIRKKGYEVYTIAPDATVFEALNLMAEHNIGALLVMTGDEIKGIVSERDCIRKVDVKGRNTKDTKISEIMTSDVITVDADQPLEECMALMIDKNIRHLPVCEGKKLLGASLRERCAKRGDRSAANDAFPVGTLHYRRTDA